MSNYSNLATYFERISGGSYFGLFDVNLNLLTLEQATHLTTLLEYHPIVRELGGLVLDDPNTSNHHLHLNRPPFCGCVLFLSHDGETRVVFNSLSEFLAAADAAKEQDRHLTELHPDCSPVVTDQHALSALIHQIVESGTANEVAVAIIPSLDLKHLALLERLVKDKDFFLGEAVAAEIQKRPSKELRSIASLCSQHSHPQVAEAGRRALKAISLRR